MANTCSPSAGQFEALTVGTVTRRSVDFALAGMQQIQAITFEWLTWTELHNWAGLVWNFAARRRAAPGFRRTSTSKPTTGGPIAIGYKICRCWARIPGAAGFDANANAIAIEHIKVENELGTRHQRDRAVPTLSTVAT